MKIFEVIQRKAINFTIHLIVEAENKEEAKEKYIQDQARRYPEAIPNVDLISVKEIK